MIRFDVVLPFCDRFLFIFEDSKEEIENKVMINMAPYTTTPQRLFRTEKNAVMEK